MFLLARLKILAACDCKACARSCATMIGRLSTFFTLSSGRRSWLDKPPGNEHRGSPHDRALIAAITDCGIRAMVKSAASTARSSAQRNWVAANAEVGGKARSSTVR